MKLLVPIVKISLKEVTFGGKNKLSPAYYHDAQTVKKRGLRKKILAGTSTVILLIAIGWLIIRSINSPAVGTVAKQDNTSGTANSPPPDLSYSDSYLYFNYPGTYQIVNVPKTGSFLDVINLSSNDHSGGYLAIGIVREALENDPGINYRRLHPDKYRAVIDSPTNVTFVATQGSYEKTSYLAHNGLVMSLSLTSTYSKDLSKTYDLVANSLKWKQ